ncbi:hypothetical protein M8J77_018894 [Diaphorina citri]|nr:hypothetical protein M8J77_018894 [Diaphorina citri]
MPHVSSVSGAGDDLGSTDEVKVFKDEGEDEKRSSENLTEDKTSLIDLTESQRFPPPRSNLVSWCVWSLLSVERRASNLEPSVEETDEVTDWHLDGKEI